MLASTMGSMAGRSLRNASARWHILSNADGSCEARITVRSEMAALTDARQDAGEEMRVLAIASHVSFAQSFA
ncbi:hypothetical protein MRB53_036877 [Persea americana]|nr:hypothetical protein MRB53_036877 [Persea americana]